MAIVGVMNRLEVVKEVQFGVYLDGGDLETILLPKKHVPNDTAIGDYLDVFLYHDFKGRLIATSQKPKAVVDECAFLEVIDVNDVGAFLDWGLDKDLLVPYNEQMVPMEKGRWYTVYVFYDDETDRIAASSRLHDFLYEESHDFVADDEVEILVSNKTEMGFKAVINDAYLGLIYKDEIFKPIRVGQRMTAYIKTIREDKRIDLCLQRTTQKGRDDLAEKIIAYLKSNDGRCTVTDKSSPELISDTFGVSKKAFKRSVGNLYKSKAIVLADGEIRLK